VICMNNLGVMRIVDESDCVPGDITEQTMNESNIQ